MRPGPKERMGAFRGGRGLNEGPLGLKSGPYGKEGRDYPDLSSVMAVRPGQVVEADGFALKFIVAGEWAVEILGDGGKTIGAIFLKEGASRMLPLMDIGKMADFTLHSIRGGLATISAEIKELQDSCGPICTMNQVVGANLVQDSPLKVGDLWFTYRGMSCGNHKARIAICDDDGPIKEVEVDVGRADAIPLQKGDRKLSVSITVYSQNGLAMLENATITVTDGSGR